MRRSRSGSSFVSANDNRPKGTYNATTNSPTHFTKPITRADVAAFLLKATTNPQWDGPTGVQLSGG